MNHNSNDILEHYINISSKLKKRFLRKPNITEACDSFISLAKKCETLELPAYSSLCYIAAARCEGSLLNNTGETSCLVQSARVLFEAEKSDRDLGCKNLSGEYLQAGLSCYAHAESRYSESCSIPISLNLEIVEFLKRIGKNEYTHLYIENSVELSKARCNTIIHCLQLLASHFINCGDFLASLEVFLEISKLADNSTPNGNRSEILLKCEINSVLLLLILRPSPQKLSPCLAKILEKYTWGDKNDSSLRACRMTEEMFLLLQSLVTTCQSLDTSSLLDLESDFWKLLFKEEKELLRILVKTYQR
ncbi:huntingtin-associated protein 40 kDa [Leptinotarsa decemlineata]|uniref:huntingtin-associated protein 40 kDa n=1 Tax=Leptinotarsa decemlineata TaxID=7539 RepID=UPI003D3057F3